MIDRKRLASLDWLLLLAAVLLAAVGVVLVASASQNQTTPYAQKQALWCVVGLIMMFTVMSIDYHRLVDQSLVFYLPLVAALLYLLVFGRIISGAQSWITVGAMRFQPSELAKITVALMLAKYFSDFRQNLVSRREVGAVAWIAGIPMALTALQPDLGTAAAFIPLVGTAFILAGTRVKWICGIAVAALLVCALSWTFFLKDYQKARLTSFLAPEADPRGSGYHSIQSRIAVGSGGFYGKGYKQGSQSRLEFLPARHTDFVFSVLAEEEGFVGTISVLGLYAVVVFRGFRIARRARDRAGLYLATALTALIAFHIVVNIGMVAGLLPITGIPLPFLSYGGSFLVVVFIAIGLIMNVRIRRTVN